MLECYKLLGSIQQQKGNKCLILFLGVGIFETRTLIAQMLMWKELGWYSSPQCPLLSVTRLFFSHQTVPSIQLALKYSSLVELAIFDPGVNTLPNTMEIR